MASSPDRRCSQWDDEDGNENAFPHSGSKKRQRVGKSPNSTIEASATSYVSSSVEHKMHLQAPWKTQQIATMYDAFQGPLYEDPTPPTSLTSSSSSFNSQENTAITGMLGNTKYVRGRKLGAGAYGSVYEVVDTGSLQNSLNPVGLVVKVINTYERDEYKIGLSPEAIAEMAMQRALAPHPNIVHIIDAFATPGKFNLIMPRADMNLSEYIKYTSCGSGSGSCYITAIRHIQYKKIILSTGSSDIHAMHAEKKEQTTTDAPMQHVDDDGARERIQIFVDIAAGLEHMHRNGVVHFDLKPQNVLIFIEPVTGCARAQITDFGSSVWNDTPVRIKCHGSQFYAAPEAETASTTASTYGYELDYWSLGMIACDLFTTTGNPMVHVVGEEGVASDRFAGLITLIYGDGTIQAQPFAEEVSEQERKLLPSEMKSMVSKILPFCQGKYKNITRLEQRKGSGGVLWFERYILLNTIFGEQMKAKSDMHTLVVGIAEVISRLFTFSVGQRRAMQSKLKALCVTLSPFAQIDSKIAQICAFSMSKTWHISNVDVHRPDIFWTKMLLQLLGERSTDTASIIQNAFVYMKRIPDLQHYMRTVHQYMHVASMVLALKKNKETDAVIKMMRQLSPNDKTEVLAAELWLVNDCLKWKL